MGYNSAKVGKSTELLRFAPVDSSPRLRGRPWIAIRDRVLKTNPLCKSCLTTGKVKIADEVDHIVPLCKGGTDALDNLQGLCKECHEEKTRQDLGQVQRPRIGVDGWPEKN